MAAPTWRSSSTPSTDAAGAWTHTGQGVPIGTLVILQVLQDGATSGAVTLDSITATRRENLAGTDNVMTYIGAFQVGGTSLAIQHLWIGRSISASSAVYTGSNSTSEDLYIYEHAFDNVITVALGGVSLATVIENVTAGATVLSTGTSTTVSDAAVTTLGPDRLAVNLVALNDDISMPDFSGQSGGTWTGRASYAEASGTDGALYLQDAAMSITGTIDGGTSTITSCGWGVVGFALIGTTAGGTTRGYAQAQAKIKALGVKAYAQAQAQISYSQITDSFTRSVSDAWGTADEGGDWTVDGTAADYDTTGTEGTIATTAAGQQKSPRLAQTRVKNFFYQAKFKVDRLAVGDSINLVLLTRKSAAGTSGDEYWSQAGLRTDGTFDVTVRRRAAGVVSSPLATTNVTRETTSTTAYFWLKTQILGTSSVQINVKLWREGTAEPTAWDTTYTDASPTALLQQVGTVGLRVDSNSLYSGSLPILFTLDDIGVYAPAAFAQAQARIKQTYHSYAQAQAKVRGTYPVHAQAQARIAPNTAVDTFTRTVDSNEWGSSDTTGAEWIRAGEGGSFAVNGSQGTFTQDQNHVIYLTAGDRNVGFYGEFSLSAQPTTQHIYHEFLVRITEPGDWFGNWNAYAAYFIWKFDTAVLSGMSIVRRIGASSVTLAAESGTTIPFVANDVYAARFEVVGTGAGGSELRFKIWNTNGAEPSAWHRTATDSTAQMQGGGVVALRAAQAPANTPVVTTDNISIYHTGTSVHAQAQAEIADVVSIYVHAQAQADIKTTYYAHAQAQADIRQTYYVHAQSQADIKATYFVHAQAQARIKQTYFAHAQSQADIKTTYFTHAQAQSYIKLVQFGFAQANALITGGFTQIVDTFTRTISDGFGTADIGGDWNVLIGPDSNISTTGTEGQIANAHNTQHILTLPQVLLPRLTEGYAKIKFSALPDSGISELNFDNLISSDYRGTSYGIGSGASIWLEYDGTLTVVAWAHGFLTTGTPISYTPDTYVWLKWRIIATDSGITVFAKTWLDGNSEPGTFSATRFRPDVELPGHFSVSTSTDGGTVPITATIDDLNVYAAFPVASGQAQAQIKTTYYVHAQAQARITSLTDVHAQAQAQIRSFPTVHAQAQASILAITYEVAQAQAQIKTNYQAFGQAQATMIKFTLRRHAQAQALMNRGFGIGQAAALIYGTPIGSDTFTRSVTDGLGTADAGGDWIITNNPTRWDVNGSEGTYQVNSGTASLAHLSQSLYSWGAELTLDFKFDTLPPSASSYIGVGAFSVGGLSINSHFGCSAVIRIDSAGNLAIFSQSNGGGSISGTVLSGATTNTYYTLKTRVFRNSLGETLSQSKVWLTSGSEPDGWQVSNTETIVDRRVNPGPAYIYAVGNTNNPIITFDNFNSYEVSMARSAQAQARIKSKGYGLGQAQATIKAIGWTEFGQAQGAIKTTYFAYSQAQADILTSNQVFAQAQAQIVQTIYEFAQAQATILQTYYQVAQAQGTILAETYVFAQAQADIKATDYAFAQAQARMIKATFTRFAQAQALMNRAFAMGLAAALIDGEPVGSDTFTRTVVNNWGTADQGGDWILGPLAVGQNALFDVDGSVGTFQDNQANTYTIFLNRSLYTRGVEIKADFKLSAYPTSGTQQFATIFGFGSVTAVVSQFARLTLTVTSAGVGSAILVVGGSSIGVTAPATYDLDTWYTAKIKVYRVTSTNRGYGLGKVWKTSDTEPGWGNLGLHQVAGGFLNPGPIGMTFVSNASNSIVSVDNLNSYEVGLTQHAQAQARITGRGYGLAQAQATIKSIGWTEFAQAQGAIKQTYQVHAQSQALIVTTVTQSAQAQANILATDYAFAQAQARIIVFGVQAYAQAHAWIEGSAVQYAQAQAKINSFDWNEFGQAQASIKQTYYVHAQAQGTVLTTYYAHGQAQADILVTSTVAAQAQGTILATYVAHAQAQALIAINEAYVHAQAQALIKQTYFGFAQANAYIGTFGIANAQAQATILATSSQVAQAQADILVTTDAYAQAQGQIKVTSNAHGQAQATIEVLSSQHAQAQASILAISSVVAQAQGTILATSVVCAQAMGAIKTVVYVQAQAQALIGVRSTEVAQAQATIKATYTQSANAQSTILTTTSNSGQAQAWIEATYTACAQAQAYIKLVQFSHAQAQATIRGNAFAQAQASVKAVTSNSGNAQATIKVTVSNHGQAISLISTLSQAFSQAQASIRRINSSVAQAQASILRHDEVVLAQAQAFIVKSAGYAQAQAWIFQKFVKSLVISDRNSTNLSLSDRIQQIVAMTDSTLTLTLTDRTFGLSLTDRALTLTLSDRDY